MRELQSVFQNYILNHKKQRKYFAVLVALSILVSFMVPIILMEPADSMTGQLICTAQEHVHSQDCRLPECVQEHEHTDGCHVLICSASEHTHSDECFTTSTEEKKLENTEEEQNSGSSLTEPSADASDEALPENIESPDAFEEVTEATLPVDEIVVLPELSADELALRNRLFMAFEVFNRAKGPAPEANGPDSLLQAAPGSILGVATHFHIFAESVSMQSHVHGNIATNELLACGAFGVYNNKLGGMDSTNYIRSIADGVGLDNAFQTQLVLGDKYTYYFDLNRYVIRDKTTGKTYTIPTDKFGGSAKEYDPRIIIEEPGKPYINIKKELKNFEELSKKIANESSSSGVTAGDGGDMNKPLTIDCTNATDKYIYQTITANQMNMWGGNSMKEMLITGLESDQFLFLTIDLTDAGDNVYFNKSWLVQNPDGSGTFGTGESPLSEGGCHVIYNFVKRDKSGKYVPFNGKIVLGERRNGAILAPAASVNGAGNTNGTFICKNFVATGETHRLDIIQEGDEDTFTDWPLLEEEVEKISIKVDKKWSDWSETLQLNNHYSDTVTVQLYKGTASNNHAEAVGAPVTIKFSDSWTYTWSNLPKLSGDQKYYVKETGYSVSNGVNYQISYNNNGVNNNNAVITVTNTRPPISLAVEKKWVGNSTGNQITVELYQSRNADLSSPIKYRDTVLNSGNGWRSEWTELPSGYYYFVKEISVDGYTTSYSSNNGTNLDGQTITITNVQKIVVPKISVSVNKTWSDTGHNNDSVEVQLYQAKLEDGEKLEDIDESQWTKVLIDGKEVVATLNSSNNWSATIKDIPQYEGVYYFFKEVSYNVSNGLSYEAAYSAGVNTDNGKFIITNTKQQVEITANKYWSDGEDLHADDNVKVQLYKSDKADLDVTAADFEQNAEKVGAEKTISAATSWKAEWKNLDKGENIYYYVKELPITASNGYDYEPSYSINGVNDNADVSITNTKRIRITVNKVWSDGEAHEADDITIKLYKSYKSGLIVNVDDFETQQENGVNLVTKVTEVTLNSANDWTAAFSNLPIKEMDANDGNKEKLVYYYIKEDPVPAGYAVSYSKNGINSISRDVTITNIKLTDITVTKSWINQNNQSMVAGFPTTEIQFHLYRYKYVPPTTTNEDGEIVPDEAAAAEFEANGYKYRPADAEKVGDVYTVKQNENWILTIHDLPTQEEGCKLYYYIEEVPNDKLENFDTTYSDDNLFYVPESGNKTITNTEKKDTEFSLTVNKLWAGIEDFAGVEDYENPVQQWNEPINVTLKRATSENVDWSTVPVYQTAEFTGNYTFTGLEMYVDNDESKGRYYYKVFETPISGYWTDYNNQLIQPSETKTGAASTEIINTHIKNKLNIRKNWYNNQTPYGSEVTKVVVEVYRKVSVKSGVSINNTGSEKGGYGLDNNPEQETGGNNPGGEVTPIIFSNTFDNNVENWIGRGAATVSVDHNSYYEGGGSLKVTGRTGGWNGAEFELDTSKLLPGNSYSFSAAVLQTSGSEKTMKISLRYTKLSTGETAFSTIGTAKANSGEWTKLEKTSYLIPSEDIDTTKPVYLYFETDGESSEFTDFYIDNVMAANAGTASSVVTGQGTVANNTVSNYLIFSNFENNSSDGWSTNGASSVTNVYHDGKNALMVTGRNAGWQGIRYDPELLAKNFEAGKTYSFSAYAWKQSEAPGSIKLTFSYQLNDATNYVMVAETGTNSVGWTKLENTSFEIPSGASNMSLYFEIGEASAPYSDFYIAEVRAANVGTASTYSLKNTSSPNKSFLGISSQQNGVLSKALDGDKEKAMELTVDPDGDIWSGNDSNVLFAAGSTEWSSFYGAALTKVEIIYSSAEHVYDASCAKISFEPYISSTKNLNGNKVIYSFDGLTIDENTTMYGGFTNPKEVRKIILYASMDGQEAKHTIYNTAYTGPATASIDFTKLDGSGNTTLLGGNDHDWLQIFKGKQVNTVQFYYPNELIAENVIEWVDGYSLSMWIGESIGSEGATTQGKNPNSKTQVNNTVVYDISNLGVMLHEKVGETEIRAGAFHVLAAGFSSPQQVEKVVVTCNDGASYIITNTNYSHVIQEEKGMVFESNTHNESTGWEGYTQLLSDYNKNNDGEWEQWFQFKGKKLSHIDVFYGCDLNDLFPGGGTFPAGNELNFYVTGNGSSSINKGTQVISNHQIRYSYQGEEVLIHTSTKGNANGDNTSINLQTAYPQYIQKVVVYCDDGSSFTINNTDSIVVAEKKIAFKTLGGLGQEQATDALLPTDDELWLAFEGRKLKQISVYYPNSTIASDNMYKVSMQVNGNGSTLHAKDEGFMDKIISNNLIAYTFTDGYLSIHESISHAAGANNSKESNYLMMSFENPTMAEKVVLECTDGSNYTIYNTAYNPGEILHKSDTIEVKDGANLLESGNKNYTGYNSKQLTHIDVVYGETLLTLPGDVFAANGTQLLAAPSSEDQAAMNHTLANPIEGITNLTLTEDSSDHHAATDIKQIILHYEDGSTYSITNANHVPKVDKPPAVEDDTNFNTGEFVFIQTVELIPENGWTVDLSNLPATDGQGNVYEYYIKEKSVYGTAAGEYTLLSYDHPDGIPLVDPDNNTGLTNGKVGKDGLIILPSTGGEGNRWYCFAGIMIMLGGIAGYFGMKQWQKRRS